MYPPARMTIQSFCRSAASTEPASSTVAATLRESGKARLLVGAEVQQQHAIPRETEHARQQRRGTRGKTQRLRLRQREDGGRLDARNRGNLRA